MQAKILFAGLLAALLGACVSTAGRLAADAERCRLEVNLGILDGAEKSCTQALGGDGNVLEPGDRSARLYELARIKRQLFKYQEGEGLLRQSLAIEEGLSGPDSHAVGLRLIELSLVLAGQEQWEAGARVVERALPLAGKFTQDERASMARIARHYAGRLEKIGQAGLAERFRTAAAELENRQVKKESGAP